MKSFLSRSVITAALVLSIFSVNHFSQTETAAKTGSVAAYVRDKDEESGIVRKRIVTAETGKTKPAVSYTIEELFDFEKKTLALINQKRAENDLDPLVWNEEIAKVARLHSENMVKFNFFGHRGTDGKMVDARADSVGLTKWTAIGENIAYNRGYNNPLETAVEKWLLSPGHRQNLLSERWKETAVGIAVTEDGTFYFTQVFLKR